MNTYMFITATPLPSFHHITAKHNNTNSRVPPKMTKLTKAQMIQPPPLTGKGSEESGQVRCRQHLNPLARRWRQPVQLPSEWYTQAFTNTDLPLIVDVGVAKGRFLYKLAEKHPSRNYLGLEIREPLVHQANRIAAQAGLTNLFYIACNANVSLADILGNVPLTKLKEVYIQFCDPWFKKRHSKRRMVNSPLVNDIFQAMSKAQLLDSHSQLSLHQRTVFIQSDVLEVANQMRYLFDQHQGFTRLHHVDGIQQDEHGWLPQNPLGEPTEREIAVLNKDGNVYRAIYCLSDNFEQTLPKLNSADTVDTLPTCQT